MSNEQPIEPYLLAKIHHACALWNEGEKALAHIHLAHTGLPLCDDGRALRLFIAGELLDNDVLADFLLKAQAFVPATPDLCKYPGQPRIPAGNGRESGEYTYGRANVTPAAFRGSKERRGHGRASSVFDAIRSFLDRLREGRTPKESKPAPERKPAHEEATESEAKSPNGSSPEQKTSVPKPSDFVGQDFGKLGTAVEKPDVAITEVTGHASERMTEYGQSIDDIQSIVSDPLIVLQQSDGRYYFLSDTGAVVVDQQGRVVTTYPAPQFGVDVKAILDFIHNRVKR